MGRSLKLCSGADSRVATSEAGGKKQKDLLFNYRRAQTTAGQLQRATNEFTFPENCDNETIPRDSSPDRIYVICQA